MAEIDTPDSNKSAIPEAQEHFDIGMDFQKINEPGKAIKEFSKAIQLDPQFTAAYIRRGDTISALALARKSHWESPPIALLQCGIQFYLDFIPLASNFLRTGLWPRISGAIDDYTAAIRLEPNNAKAYISRANCYMRTDDSERAILDFSEAIRLEPNNLHAYNGRHLALMSKVRSLTDAGTPESDCKELLDKANTDYRKAFWLKEGFIERQPTQEQQRSQ